MIGLMLLGFITIYLYASVKVTKAAINWAKANDRKPWLWGGLAAFVMYNLVFWDWIPTVVMHKYYCSTQAGFWVYKTPEQWVKENANLELKPSDTRTYEGTDNDYVATKSLNQRLNNVSKLNPESSWLPIYKSEQYIATSETGKTLIQRKNFLSGYRERNGIGQLKLWMGSGSCDEENKTLLAFGIVEEKFRNLNDGEQK